MELFQFQAGAFFFIIQLFCTFPEGIHGRYDKKFSRVACRTLRILSFDLKLFFIKIYYEFNKYIRKI